MIFDATFVEVMCDNKDCGCSVLVDLPAGARSTYLADDDMIEKRLVSWHEWVVEDGRHFCSEECRDADVERRQQEECNYEI